MSNNLPPYYQKFYFKDIRETLKCLEMGELLSPEKVKTLTPCNQKIVEENEIMRDKTEYNFEQDIQHENVSPHTSPATCQSSDDTLDESPVKVTPHEDTLTITNFNNEETERIVPPKFHFIGVVANVANALYRIALTTFGDMF